MKFAQKLLALTLISASLPILTSCERHSASEHYYLVSANVRLPYWQNAYAGFGKGASEQGVTGQLMGPDTYDPTAQVKEFRSAVAGKPAGILVSVADPKLMTPEIDSAVAAGIPVITMDSDAPDSKRLFFIGTNNLQAGRLGGQTLVKALNGHGSVVFFTMPGQSNLDERLKGYMDVLGEHTGIRVVDTVDIRGDSRVAFDKTATYVTKTGGDKVDAFVCLEASSGKDVAEAIKRANATGRTILAMDTDDATLKLIQDGTIAASIAQKPWTMAYLGLNRLADIQAAKTKQIGGNYANDPQSPYPVFIDTGTTLVDKSNVSQFMKAQ
jgi:ribose transport system substrate-binding protein